MNGSVRILIVTATFYEDIATALVNGATQELLQGGALHELVEVPGAFEIPAAIAFAAQTKRFDGYVALGCVIRGETSHYDYVCGESARGLMDLAIGKCLAIGYGILTVETHDQAWQRAAVDRGNKGASAAAACMSMVKLRREVLVGV